MRFDVLRPDGPTEQWLATIVVDSLRGTRDLRLLSRWRTVLTALTPWNVAVSAAACPGSRLEWLSKEPGLQADRDTCRPANGRALRRRNGASDK